MRYVIKREIEKKLDTIGPSDPPPPSLHGNFQYKPLGIDSTDA